MSGADMLEELGMRGADRLEELGMRGADMLDNVTSIDGEVVRPSQPTNTYIYKQQSDSLR